MTETQVMGQATFSALSGMTAFYQDVSTPEKSKGLRPAFHFSFRFNILPSCRALREHSALPSRTKCHGSPLCHFPAMTPLRIPAKQNHNQPLRQRPRKGHQGSGADRQVSQSGKPLCAVRFRSLNLPAGRCPLGSPGREFHPCTRNAQKISRQHERSTGPSIRQLAFSAKGLLALCTPRQRRCPCIPSKGPHPFGIPPAPAQRFPAFPAGSLLSPDAWKFSDCPLL